MNEEILKDILTIIPHDRVTMSPHMDQYFTAFAQVQEEMEPVKKASRGHRHNYANINDVLMDILPILSKYGFIIHQPVITVDDKDRLQTVIGHKSGQWMSFGSLRIIHDPNDIQSQGGGITYTRRYSAVSVMGLPQEDDDGESVRKSVKVNGQKEPITTQHVDDLKRRIIEARDDTQGRNALFKEIMTTTKCGSLEQLTDKQYYFVCKEFFGKD